MAKKVTSIEEQIEDWCKKQFNGQKYYTKTESINAEIEAALEKAPKMPVNIFFWNMKLAVLLNWANII